MNPARIFNSTLKLAIVIFIVYPVFISASCRGRKTTSARNAGENMAGTVKVQPSQMLDKSPEDKPSTEGEKHSGEKTQEVIMAENFKLSLEEKKYLMKIAKESVKASINGKDYKPPEPPTQKLKDKGAAFVTLKKGGMLRGCIGHIIAQMPLYMCVASVAKSAAVEDPRFPPVKPSEYSELHFEISVLTPPQEVKDPLKDIKVGRDGVIINYGGFHQGVFLPQVPIEQGWGLEEYLDNLCFKAGVYKKGCWREPNATVRKFQAIVWEEEDVQ